MAPEAGNDPPRKVRSACRRCRTKRIKCDGGIPACSNCARAKVPCIDVHTGNNDLSIPRDFAVRCCSRITWLEQQLQSLCPDFDLSQGPQVNMDFHETFDPSRETTRGETAMAGHASTSHEPHAFEESHGRTVTSKRSHSTMESDASLPVSANARSVAIDLGMLSLQSDSRQKHYLGSSSGLLFTKLMGLDNESSPAQSTPATRLLAPPRVSDEIYRALYSQLQREIPTPEDACVLLEVYFQDIHINQPFLHPASLVNAYQALYKCAQNGYDGSVNRNGWPHTVSQFPYNGKLDAGTAGDNMTPISISAAIFHVFTAFSLAATILTRKKNYSYSPRGFQRMAMLAASETFSNISVVSLQGILLLAVQSLIEPAGVNIWTISHMAMSHCIDLGLHREPSDSDMSVTAIAVLRFIFYTVYSLDRSIATIQGRPLGIRDETFDINFPTHSDIATMATIPNDDAAIRLPTPQLLALSILRFHLDRHVSEIKLLLYHLPTRMPSFVWPTNHAEIQTRIKSELDQWLMNVHSISSDAGMYEEEKVKLRFEKIRHEQLYHSVVTLLFQPCQMIPSPTQEALSLCYQSCSKRLELYDACANQDMLYYNWRNINGIFSSGATIVYCAWVSRDLQRTIPFAKLLRDLRICSNHLSIGSQWWPSVRSGKESFEMMIDLIITYYRDLQAQDLVLPPRQRIRTDPGQPHSAGNSSIVDSSYELSEEAVFTSPNQAQQDSAGTQQRSQGPHAGNLTTAPFGGGDDFSTPNIDHLTSAEISIHDPDAPSIEAAMESFMAEYFHEDWGWDPFSGFAGLFDHPAEPS